MFHRPSILALAIAAAFALSACGGGSSSTAQNAATPQAAVQTGVFLDSAVAGVDYTTDGDATPRQTNADGEFQIVAALLEHPTALLIVAFEQAHPERRIIVAEQQEIEFDTELVGDIIYQTRKGAA